MTWKMVVFLTISMVLAWKLWYLILIAFGFILLERMIEHLVKERNRNGRYLVRCCTFLSRLRRRS